MDSTSEIKVRETIDHLFRHQTGQMVSVLSRIFGLDKLDLIEDAVQDSLVAAMQKWPFSGMPDNPRAWLIQVAKNRLFDGLRRSNRFQAADEEEAEKAVNSFENLNGADPIYFANEIGEDQLRMIFACCHPAIHADRQVALTLKIVGGFSIGEISRAFLAKDESIAKLVTRARQRLRDGNVELEIPAPDDIPPRLEAVMKVLYLMFNEGYSASGGEELIRRDLCFEAIRLSGLLAVHPMTAGPAVDALTALFLFQTARFSSRCDFDGELLLLSEQDRTLWDREMINRGAFYFHRSALGDKLTDYHLEAEIAAYHTFAPDFDSTDWRGILSCYDLMQRRKFSPVVELNRIIVLSKLDGVEKALIELGRLAQDHKVKDYNLYHITRAKFLADSGLAHDALSAYQAAHELTQNEKIRSFINRRIAELGQPSAF